MNWRARHSVKLFPAPLEDRIDATVRIGERRRSRARFKELRRDVERVRATRRHRVYSNDAMVCLVLSKVEDAVSEEAWDNSDFLEIHEEKLEIQKEYGLGPDDFWFVDEGPPEWHALGAEWVRRFDALQVQWLRELGFRDIANLFERDRDALHRRWQRGHDEIYGPPIEEEVERARERIRQRMEQWRREHPLRDWRLGPI